MLPEQIWQILGGVLGIVSLWSGIILWVFTRVENRLDAHMKSSEEHFNAMTARIDATGARIDAMGARIDAMGTRIDTTQAIIMRMLEKQGR